MPLGINTIVTAQAFRVESEKTGWLLSQEASFKTPSAALDQMMGTQESSLLSLSMQL